MRSYRDLRVRRIGMDLVETVYDLTRGFPPDEIYGLVGQMRRAAVSIPSNIAEGHARRYRKEYRQHLSVALASLAELETQVEIALRLQYIANEENSVYREQSDSFGKQLRSLIAALSRDPNP